MSLSLESIQREWDVLTQEFQALQDTHQTYMSKLSEVYDLQAKCAKAVKHQHYRLSQIKHKLKRFDGKASESTVNDTTQDDQLARDILNEISERRTLLGDIKGTLPKEDNGLYLNVILGDVNVALLNKSERFRYKDDYEKFKLTLTLIALVVDVFALMYHTRFLDAVFLFLMVWYYCTLTIRESILRINGSKMKGWWVAHHYISAIMSGIFITWPDGACYQSFRTQFLIFSAYISFVGFMQYFYQRGCLYRLRSLGDRDLMDITIEGFHTWMFRGLNFLLPFLLVGYVFQFHNAVTLYLLWRKFSCPEWQVLTLALCFLVIAVGNSYTTLRVVFNKWTTDLSKPSRRRRLETKYSHSVAPSTSPATPEHAQDSQPHSNKSNPKQD
jgi:hypothetical protein